MLVKCRSVALIPIGLGVVKLEDSVSPVEVSHVRPVILVEAGGALEQLLVDVQDELFFNRVDLESAPRNGKKLVAHAQEPPEGQNCVSDTAIRQVDHQMFDLSEIFPLMIHDLIACKSVCCYNFWLIQRFRLCHPLSFLSD